MRGTAPGAVPWRAGTPSPAAYRIASGTGRWVAERPPAYAGGGRPVVHPEWVEAFVAEVGTSTGLTLPAVYATLQLDPAPDGVGAPGDGPPAWLRLALAGLAAAHGAEPALVARLARPKAG